MNLIEYSDIYKNQWNNFIPDSKNGTFLLDRNYMDYHSSRFIDNSLIFMKKGKICGLLPLNSNVDTGYSHQGLTYGGFIYSKDISVKEVIEMFNLTNLYFSNKRIKTIVYKPIPYIYYSYPSQEDLYCLFKLQATLICRNISSTINQSNRLKFTESRLSGLRKAHNNAFQISEPVNFQNLWTILENNLQIRYNTKPVHSFEEIQMLYNLFPDNIKLFTVNSNENLIAGCVIYKSKNVAHSQYIVANEEGKQSGALDFLFDYLINHYFIDCQYFDLGSSNESMGNYLNTNLIFQKEGFGGRAVCYDTYSYNTDQIISI
jgi:hypothetical protein